MHCGGLAGLLVLQAGSQVATVLVILVINSLLAYSSRLLTVFEKHHTRSSEACSLAWKLFMAQVGPCCWYAALHTGPSLTYVCSIPQSRDAVIVFCVWARATHLVLQLNIQAVHGTGGPCLLVF
jgi:hypothetical protein